MLTIGSPGQAYIKSENPRALLQLLPGRCEGAIKFKHCNISAVVIQPGFLHMRDDVAREASTQSLGLAAEELVVPSERWRLIQRGHERLASRNVVVRAVSREAMERLAMEGINALPGRWIQ